MKRKENQQPLGSIVKTLISIWGMEDGLMNIHAEELFKEMMGNYIMNYVENYFVKNRELFVKIKSPELKNELQYGKSKILEHINQEIGKEYLTAVNFL